jgi:hypothetical protein
VYQRRRPTVPAEIFATLIADTETQQFPRHGERKGTTSQTKIGAALEMFCIGRPPAFADPRLDETGGGSMGLQAHEPTPRTELAFRPGTFLPTACFVELAK